ncbi:MAG: hypothetical protein RL559_1216 [Pseudomonadota bacterium]|jgi:crotonobetainyl-CoA:carnitine CoA-transferase CaiB-like acyl-CoA transferase
MRPLHGIRVLDLSSVIFGPLASQILADYGAEVIKIEAPEGDSTRQTGPATEPGMSAIFLGANHSKHSVVLDLKRADAREALQALIASADVLMHSMRPQKLPALGLDPAQVRQRHPRLVFANLLGFLEGPYQGRPAYDDVIQGMSGLADLMARQTGETRYLPTIAADKTCAHVAAHAILAALLQRERGGQGCVVDIPMFESMVHFNLVEHLYGQHFEPPLAEPGYPRVLAPWRRPYRTRDGHVAMMPYTNTHWRRFFDAVGEPERADDPRFVDMAARTRHIAALLELVSEFVEQHDTAHWLALCERLEIPAAPVRRLEDLPQDPHLHATGFFETLHDPQMGTLRFTATPVRFNGQRHPVSLPPRLGQHTRAQLLAAGLSTAQIDALLASGAAREASPPTLKAPT